jgi:hypothetical protein
VWKNVKHDRVGRTDIDSQEDLKGKALAALYRLQKLPHSSPASSTTRSCATSPPEQSSYPRSAW